MHLDTTLLCSAGFSEFEGENENALPAEAFSQGR